MIQINVILQEGDGAGDEGQHAAGYAVDQAGVGGGH